MGDSLKHLNFTCIQQVKQASKGDNGLCVYSLHVPTRETSFFDVKGGNGLMLERTHVSPHAILSKINLFSKKLKIMYFLHS